jgi:hypothetical protein
MQQPRSLEQLTAIFRRLGASDPFGNPLCFVSRETVFRG